MSIRKQYDTDLESLKNSLTEMGRNSADAVENALEALCVADADAAAAIVKGDARINNMERDIEHRCMTLLLRQQPVAGDLRRISTAMKVVTDIERIGDHAADIAEIIPHLVTVRKEGDPAVSQAIAMGKKAHQSGCSSCAPAAIRTRACSEINGLALSVSRCSPAVPLFVTCGDISPRLGENLSSKGEPLAKP